MTIINTGEMKMNTPKKLDVKYGDIWITAKGRKVRRVHGPAYATTIETAYLDGKIDGYWGANFDLEGNQILGNDKLVERVE